MKSLLLIGAALLVPVIAAAQTAPAPAEPAKPAAAAKFTLDTPIGELLANEQAKAVLDKDLPGLTQLPQIEMIKGLSLKQLQPYSDGKLTDELLAKTETSLAAIK
ncbi:hypothetical protein OK349_09765 [Sphingomonas sp. BT-65]|uniref:hypothetical protein n=1 Tax=Sphingomonas sp. BT-65 TaxID=2989821 RepID=UPI0022357B27|nr:hypothetical protein [Sphingomonas sp. BT-65]MCW4461992.1 hypothetical protein [Sphingomonas sp. BT-65]